MLPWPSGRGGRLIQTSVSWMNVYPGLTVEEEESRLKRFPLGILENTLPVQLMVSAWFRSF
jgi:hypothetical protein